MTLLSPHLPSVRWVSEPAALLSGRLVGGTWRPRGTEPIPGEVDWGRWIRGLLTSPPFAFGADDVRLFAFVRFTTGDAMSKRSKFALITWIGENVSGLQRAKTGTDKTLVKEVVQVTLLVFFEGLGLGATIQQGRDGLRWAPGLVTLNVSVGLCLWTTSATGEMCPRLFSGCGLGGQ